MEKILSVLSNSWLHGWKILFWNLQTWYANFLMLLSEHPQLKKAFLLLPKNHRVVGWENFASRFIASFKSFVYSFAYPLLNNESDIVFIEDVKNVAWTSLRSTETISAAASHNLWDALSSSCSCQFLPTYIIPFLSLFFISIFILVGAVTIRSSMVTAIERKILLNGFWDAFDFWSDRRHAKAIKHQTL